MLRYYANSKVFSLRRGVVRVHQNTGSDEEIQFPPRPPTNTTNFYAGFKLGSSIMEIQCWKHPPPTQPSEQGQAPQPSEPGQAPPPTQPSEPGQAPPPTQVTPKSVFDRDYLLLILLGSAFLMGNAFFAQLMRKL